ncbi:MAG TPA: Ig-like domain-containing protein, partial [Pontibacter sp.]
NNYDFVGSEQSGSKYVQDTDHAGMGSARNEDLVELIRNGQYTRWYDGRHMGLNYTANYLDVFTPDIILLHNGTNEINNEGADNSQAVVNDLEDLLNEIDKYETRTGREITVIVAKLIKSICNGNDCFRGETSTKNDIIELYNNKVQVMVQRRIAQGDRLELVDMADAGIIYAYAYAGGDMADRMHPLMRGYDKMAKVWYPVLDRLLNVQLQEPDTQAPETNIVAKPALYTNSKTASFSFSSNEAGVIFQASLNGAAYVAVPANYTLTNLPEGTHTIKVRAIDKAGNVDPTPATYTWTIDTQPPAPPAIVAISEDRGPSATDQVTSDNTLVLSGTAEAAAKITISLTGKGTIGTATASSSGKWEFDYTQTTLQDGEHTFTATATDAAGNTSTVSPSFKVTIDQVAPAVTIATEAKSPVNKSFTISISFTKAVYELTLSDFIITNGTISNLQKQSTATYTATIVPATDGKVSVQLPASRVTDLAGNGNKASGVLEIQSDLTWPKVALSSDAPALVNTSFLITITFNEDVSGFTAAAINVTNAGISDFKQVNARTYTAKVVSGAQGEVIVRVPEGVAADAAGNKNEASEVLRRQHDSVAPAGYAVVFGVQQVTIENEHNSSMTITGAEADATYTYSITSSNGGAPVTGTGKAKGATVSIQNLDLSGLGDGTLTAELYLTDEAGNKGEKVRAQVTKVTKNIASVPVSGVVKVPFGTVFSKVQLPQKVKVTYSTGEEAYLAVAWQQGNYNPRVAGKYALMGTLELAPGTSNIHHYNGSITVEVEPNQPPTAIILSTDKFKPDAKPADVLATFATEDPEDNEFTYSLVPGAGAEQNSLFSIVNNELHLNSNKGLSGSKSFNIRVRTTDPYNNTFEQAFVLTKLPYEQKKIELVNAFSPDGDGINDTWTVPELRFYNDVEIVVMDRSGVRLFHTTDPEKGWDGKAKNGQVQSGAYFYIIRVNDINLVQKGVLIVLK